MMLLITIQVFYPLLPLYAMGYMLGTSLLHSYVVEDEKEEYRRELEEAAARDQEQKKELSESREALKAALEEAKRANRAKTAFLSNMSHEIRTPMNAIIGLNNIAMNDPTASEQIDTMIGGHCQEKGITYTSTVNGHLDEYYIGDVLKLKQVLINILGNSVKFTSEGGKVDLLVEEGEHYAGKAVVIFTISDTGIGMTEEFMEHIFEVFSQEDTSATTQYGSTGLGMPITKSIVDLKNGKEAVEHFADHEEGYYDAVLMDMRMPEMDGLEATRIIRKMDRSDAKSIPIIRLIDTKK